jgi:hypothetical protein
MALMNPDLVLQWTRDPLLGRKRLLDTHLAAILWTTGAAAREADQQASAVRF